MGGGVGQYIGDRVVHGEHAGEVGPAQDPQDLIWIREKFLDYPLPHPKVIVHGHTPADQVEIMGNRVNVDTRAFASGRLSALMVEGGRKSLLEVSGPPR